MEGLEKREDSLQVAGSFHLEMGWTWPIPKFRLRNLCLFSFMSLTITTEGFPSSSSSSSSSSRGFLYTLQFNAPRISLY